MDDTRYELMKELVESQLSYMSKMPVIDSDFNEGERVEAERTLNWLRDRAENEFFVNRSPLPPSQKPGRK